MVVDTRVHECSYTLVCIRYAAGIVWVLQENETVQTKEEKNICIQITQHLANIVNANSKTV